MTSAMACIREIAVGGTSLICYLLMTRLQNRSANRGSSGHSCGPDGGNDTGGGWSISSWFGGDNLRVRWFGQSERGRRRRRRRMR